MNPRNEAYKRFCQDVPEEKREEICEMIGEAAMDEGYINGRHDLTEHFDGAITIYSRQWYDVINVSAEGSIIINEKEYTFVVSCGNINGFDFDDWDTGAGLEEPDRSGSPALIPLPKIIDDAIRLGRGPLLIMKWDALLQNEEISSIPGKLAYDRFFQPGHVTNTYWTNKAAEKGFEIATQYEANDLRKRLKAATEELTY